MCELFTATRRLAVQELGKWILRDTFDKSITYWVYDENINYRTGRVLSYTRDGTYAFRVYGEAPDAPTNPGRILAFRPVATWKKDITYAYVIVSDLYLTANGYIEILLRHSPTAPYTWGVRIAPRAGNWKYLQSDGTWADGTFTFTGQYIHQGFHYGLVVNPQTGKYVALYIHGERYDIHTLEAPTGVKLNMRENFLAYGLYLEDTTAQWVDFDEVGVAVL